MRRRRKQKKPALPAIAGIRNIVRVNPMRGTWTCHCESVNTVHFKRPVEVGWVFPSRLRCQNCAREYRGRFITGPVGTM